MRKNAFNSEERISAINKFRIAMNGNPFTKEQILAMFKESRIPTNPTFWSVFRKSGIIKEVSKGQFAFASDNPVFWGDLERIYRQYKNIRKKYTKLPESAENQKEEDKYSSEDALKALEAFSIEFLKERGYKILAPVATIYEEV